MNTHVEVVFTDRLTGKRFEVFHDGKSLGRFAFMTEAFESAQGSLISHLQNINLVKELSYDTDLPRSMGD